MIRFFREDSAAWYLTFLAGNIAHYGEEAPGFRITLNFHDDPNDPAAIVPNQAELMFKLEPRATIDDPASPIRWWFDREDLDELRSIVEAKPSFQAWGRLPAMEVLALSDDDHREGGHALYDCWGVRDPSRPIVSMTQPAWETSDDVPLMVRWFRQQWPGDVADLDRLLCRYFLACCRRIWRLLPMEASRRGVEVTERFLDGLATREEWHRAEYQAEGAAFSLEDCSWIRGDQDPVEAENWRVYEAERHARNNRLVGQVAAISAEELRQMVRPSPDDVIPSPREILESAAYFADAAIGYPGRPPEGIERYQRFFSAPLLREVVGNPFCV